MLKPRKVNRSRVCLPEAVEKCRAPESIFLWGTHKREESSLRIVVLATLSAARAIVLGVEVRKELEDPAAVFKRLRRKNDAELIRLKLELLE
jgi:hypothetical protein